MDEGLKKQALEWFERGDHNIATAKMLLYNKWYTDLDLCEKATKYYIEDRYPPGPLVQYSYSEIEGDMEKAFDLIRKIREIIGF